MKMLTVRSKCVRAVRQLDGQTDISKQ